MINKKSKNLTQTIWKIRNPKHEKNINFEALSTKFETSTNDPDEKCFAFNGAGKNLNDRNGKGLPDCFEFRSFEF